MKATNIKLVSEPIVDVVNSKVVYNELLIREYNQFKGVQEILEHVNKFDLGNDMLESGCLLLNRTEGLKQQSVGVNVSVEEINSRMFYANKKKQFESLKELLSLRESQIIFEINEDSNFTDINLYRNIALLKNLGFKIALDDFGTKNLTLRKVVENYPKMIKELDIDILKIDKLYTDERMREDFLDIRDYCIDTGKQVVIEGVETEEIEKYVTDNGINIIQGYINKAKIFVPAQA